MAMKRQKHKLDKIRAFIDRRELRALQFYLGNLAVAEINRLIGVSRQGKPNRGKEVVANALAYHLENRHTRGNV